MTLEQIYEAANSDFNEVIERVPNRPLLLRLIKMFLNDPSKAALDKAVEEKNPGDAFKAVHTMKGVTLSLGLKTLSEPCIKLTENLRPGTFGDGWEENYGNLCKAYTEITDLIGKLEA